MLAVLVGFVTFIALDGLWLGVLMGRFYRTALGPIARTAADGSLAPMWLAAAPVYLLLALGEWWFVLPKAAGSSLGFTALWGAAFGLVTYGVYDFTNWSTLRGYSPTLVFVDIAWGMLASATVAIVMRRLAG
jgi:uncharacterized membrane protein